VDGFASNGCEQGYNAVYYSESTAYYLGSYSCFDDEGGSFSGTILSDARVHSPAANGRDPNTGAAPQWWRAFASGGACTNDPDMTITMAGGTSGCYRLSFKTDKGTNSATIVNGSARITLGSGAYSDDTNVYFIVEKICSTTIRERAVYTVTYHL
jgi:hypothetical protein